VGSWQFRAAERHKIMSEDPKILDNLVTAIRTALQEDRLEAAVSMLLDLHYADQAEIFDELEEDERTKLLTLLNPADTADILEELEDRDVLDVVDEFSPEQLADVLDEMEPDEAADLLGDLPPDQVSDILARMEAADEVRPLLNYDDETAGGLMTTSYIALRRYMTADQAIAFLREISPDADIPYYLYVIDRFGHLIGVVGIRELVVTSPQTLVETIMDPEVIHVQSGTDQEEVARIMTRYDLPMVPVVDTEQVLVGVITHDDILDVLEDEATEDIYRMANVTDIELEPESPILQQLQGRLPWLFINTLTAGFAAWVVSNFEDTIATVAALAVFQSIIAGQGGNSASQNVAMIVRAMALGRMDNKRFWPILGRQLLVGFMQGLAVGLLVGIGAYLWRGNPYFGLVVGLALVGNMILAGIIGTVVPVMLGKIGQDPALASSVLVTAVTDSGGFFIFFMLADTLIKRLV
jgi:magnesium transporter